MKLESEGRPAIQNAQAGEVHAAVSGLALPYPSFLILTRTRTSYVQVAMQGGERFVIEYREGGPRDLLRARKDFSRNEVAQLLESYLAGGDAWRAGIEWRPDESMRPRDIWDTISILCTFTALAVLLDLGCSMKASGGRGMSGKDPMMYLSIAMLVYLPSVLIDMRRFRRLDANEKTRTVVALLLGVIALLYWIGRWTGR